MAVIHDVMPAFELFQPATIGDVVTLLNRYGPDAWIMAGGMDSFDWLKDRIKRPKVVVELSQVEGVRGIQLGESARRARRRPAATGQRRLRGVGACGEPCHSTGNGRQRADQRGEKESGWLLGHPL